MPIVNGTVTCLQVEDDIGFAGIAESAPSNTTEFFVLWFNPGDPSAFTRIMQSMWLSMLKDSLLTGKSVEMSFDNTYTLLYVRLNNV